MDSWTYFLTHSTRFSHTERRNVESLHIIHKLVTVEAYHPRQDDGDSDVLHFNKNSSRLHFLLGHRIFLAAYS